MGCGPLKTRWSIIMVLLILKVLALVLTAFVGMVAALCTLTQPQSKGIFRLTPSGYVLVGLLLIGTVFSIVFTVWEDRRADRERRQSQAQASSLLSQAEIINRGVSDTAVEVSATLSRAQTNSAILEGLSLRLRRQSLPLTACRMMVAVEYRDRNERIISALRESGALLIDIQAPKESAHVTTYFLNHGKDAKTALQKYALSAELRFTDREPFMTLRQAMGKEAMPSVSSPSDTVLRSPQTLPERYIIHDTESNIVTMVYNYHSWALDPFSSLSSSLDLHQVDSPRYLEMRFFEHTDVLGSMPVSGRLVTAASIGWPTGNGARVVSWGEGSDSLVTGEGRKLLLNWASLLRHGEETSREGATSLVSRHLINHLDYHP